MAIRWPPYRRGHLPEICHLFWSTGAPPRRATSRALDACKEAPKLARLLSDGQTNVRQTAVDSLSRLGATDYAATMAKLLQDDESTVQLEAAEALGRMCAKEQAPEIAKLLSEDEEESLRVAAARALGRIGAKEQEAELVKLLKDDEPRVFRAASWALVWLGDSKGVDFMLESDLSDLSPLNSLLRSDVWKRIEQASMGTDAHGSREELLGILAKRVGLSLEISPKLTEVWSSETVFLAPQPVHVAFQNILPSNSAFILDVDRIRIVTQDMAHEYWKREWEKRRKQK